MVIMSACSASIELGRSHPHTHPHKHTLEEALAACPDNLSIILTSTLNIFSSDYMWHACIHTAHTYSYKPRWFCICTTFGYNCSCLLCIANTGCPVFYSFCPIAVCCEILKSSYLTVQLQNIKLRKDQKLYNLLCNQLATFSSAILGTLSGSQQKGHLHKKTTRTKAPWLPVTSSGSGGGVDEGFGNWRRLCLLQVRFLTQAQDGPNKPLCNCVRETGPSPGGTSRRPGTFCSVTASSITTPNATANPAHIFSIPPHQ